uniref:serine/threonine-protein kinase PEPKR2-like n=1 Tax=Styela clava TaxID=7725 RepID=UPI00193A6519|nr:serine/threonine-protein kinase PEPKR2-like [Styela clava]
MQMLMKWKQNAGSAATVSKIRAIVRGYKNGDSNEDFINVGGAYRAFRDQPLCGRRHVYRGEQLSEVTGPRPVAIKFLDFNKRNLQEAKVLLKLALHPNVVSIIHSDVYHGDPFTRRMFIVMELCHEENLTDFLKNRQKMRVPFDDNLAISFAQQLLYGLQFIHQNDVIHRDLKPDNILLSLDKKAPKISDFGLSKELRKGRSYTAQSIMRAGTDGYRAPETYNDDVISIKSDTYSMGLVIYAVWSDGKHPFGEDPDGWNMYIKKNKNRDLSHLLISDKTKAVSFLKKMLQFEPKNRPTADKLLADELFQESVRGDSYILPTKLENLTLESEELQTEVQRATGQNQDLEPLNETTAIAALEAVLDFSNIATTEVSNAKYENVIIFTANGRFSFYKPAIKEWREWKEIFWLSDGLYSTVAVNEYLYVLMANKDVYRTKYADAEPIWERLSDIISFPGPSPLAVAMSGCIYLCGCFERNRHRVERYNSTTNEWQKIENMKTVRSFPQVVAAKGRLYCFGGFGESGRQLRSGEVFDPETSKWEFTARMWSSTSLL